MSEVVRAELPVVVIGGGPVGLAAAAHLLERGLEPVVLEAGDGPGAYAYPVDERCEWIGLNIEQQAMVVEHRFLQSRGARVPADPAFYQRICPIGMADF